MLFSSFAHKLLLVFGVFVFIVVAILAARLGLLGGGAQLWISWVFSEIERIYGPNKAEIDFAAKAIGALGTALGAAWTVHKGWHYAERNLPERLKQFNARWKDEIERSRPDLNPALSETSTIAAPMVVQPGALQRIISWLHDPVQKALASCQDELSRVEGEFSVLTSGKVRCRAEVVSAHLALGSQLAKIPGQGQQALNSFRRALSFNSSDLDALELAAKQAFALGLRQQASDHLNKLAEVAEGRNPIRRARALRFHAEILHGGLRADRDAAREKLIAAISALHGADARDRAVRECELGFANQQLAAVQITRERFFAARTALNAARQHFANVPHGESSLQELEDRLSRAEKDKDNRDVQD